MRFLILIVILSNLISFTYSSEGSSTPNLLRGEGGLDYTVTMVWLAMDPGGRPSGMGKAFTSISNDANATYYNPAGLSYISKREVNFMHEPRSFESDTSGLGGMFYDFGSFVFTMGRLGNLGIGFLYHDMGKSEARDEHGNLVGIIHSYGFSPSISIGRKITNTISIGTTFRVAYEHLSDDPRGKMTTFAFDIGYLMRPKFAGGRLGFGVVLKNIGKDPKVGQPIERSVRLGTDVVILNDKLNDLVVAFDYTKVLIKIDKSFVNEIFDQGVFKFGFEYFYMDIVGFRSGYYSDQQGEITGPTFGFGIRYKGFVFDYATVPEGKESFGRENRFSFSYMF
ncbi:MAG: PorV/PorQ family protein [bacterium]